MPSLTALQFEAIRALDDDEKEALKALLEGFSSVTTPAGGRTDRQEAPTTPTSSSRIPAQVLRR